MEKLGFPGFLSRVEKTWGTSSFAPVGHGQINDPCPISPLPPLSVLWTFRGQNRRLWASQHVEPQVFCLHRGHSTRRETQGIGEARIARLVCRRAPGKGRFSRGIEEASRAARTQPGILGTVLNDVCGLLRPPAGWGLPPCPAPRASPLASSACTAAFRGGRTQNAPVGDRCPCNHGEQWEAGYSSGVPNGIAHLDC